jgi:diguanylate cyclase (GGDEF)-like protein
VNLDLWRMSTAVQVTSVILITLFFAAYARQARTAEGRAWRNAWCLNLAALVVTVLFWSLQPTGLAFHVAAAAYMGTKLAFALLVAEGAWRVARPGATLPRARWLHGACIAYALACGVFIRTLPQIGVLQHTIIPLVLLPVIVVALRGETRSLLGWLAAGLATRAATSAAAAWAYGLELGAVAPTALVDLERARFFLSGHSAIDAGAEWLIALGMVFAMSARQRRALEASNAELLAAQESLRTLADRDALTGLPNRRALPAALRAAQPGGAMILYLDLDDFKGINDLHGHAVGDAVLARFAAAVRESFRPEDTIVRHGGDEFVVVAPGLDASRTEERLMLLRGRLQALRGDGPSVRFSAGVARLEPGGYPDEALAAADSAMYAAKRRRGATQA